MALPDLARTIPDACTRADCLKTARCLRLLHLEKVTNRDSVVGFSPEHRKELLKPFASGKKRTGGSVSAEKPGRCGAPFVVRLPPYSAQTGGMSPLHRTIPVTCRPDCWRRCYSTFDEQVQA